VTRQDLVGALLEQAAHDVVGLDETHEGRFGDLVSQSDFDLV